MAVLSDAELALGLSRHLSAYVMGPERAALESLEFSGRTFEMAFRLRGSTTAPASRVNAIGIDAGLSARLLKEVMVTLEALSWISINRDAAGQAISVNETIPPAGSVVDAADRVFTIAGVDAIGWAALSILRAAAMIPVLRVDALSAAAAAPGATDEIAESALRHLVATGLVRSVVIDDGREVIYNPNIWTQGEEIAASAARAADAHATSEVLALMEEVAAYPGIPEASITSTEPKWVQFAVSQGLVHRAVIQTTEGDEQGFLFSPHLTRDPFGGSQDVSGHTRQMVGSMVYAATFANVRLWSPRAFLGRLVRDGVAGNASPIGTDYPMLEKAGIVRIAPTSAGKFQMELLQPDVAQAALDLLVVQQGANNTASDASAIRAQKAYLHVERDRARLAQTADTDDAEQRRLISALRDVTARNVMGGGA